MAARVTILDFWSEWLKLLLIYKSPLYFLSNFESMGLSIQEKKFRIDFQDGNCGSHLLFPTGTILAIFDLQVTSMPLTMLSIGLSVQEKKWKTDFQDGCHGGHLGFPFRTILAIFDLPVTPMLPNKFWVSWPFGSGEEAKNRFFLFLTLAAILFSRVEPFYQFW